MNLSFEVYENLQYTFLLDFYGKYVEVMVQHLRGDIIPEITHSKVLKYCKNIINKSSICSCVNFYWRFLFFPLDLFIIPLNDLMLDKQFTLG